MTSKNNTGNNTASILIVLVIVFSFPIWIGIVGGIFGIATGVVGAFVGIVMAIFQVALSLILLPFKILFGGEDCDSFFFGDFNGYALAAVIIIIALVLQKKK